MGAGLAWREATDDPTPRSLTAAEASTTGDLGRRTYTEISGAYSMTYVERYEDTNDNGSQDPDETGMEWVYILTSGDPPVGLFVQSDRPPQEVLARSFAGSLVNDRASVAEVAGILGDAGGIVIDPDLYLDTSVEAVDPEPFDPGAADRPGPGTTATVDGSVHTTVVPVCPTDPACELQDAIAFVYLVYHPDDDRGLLVYSESAPVGLVDGTVTGMIRIGSDRVADLLTTYAAALDLAGAGITISGERFLDASARPASAPLVGGHRPPVPGTTTCAPAARRDRKSPPHVR